MERDWLEARLAEGRSIESIAKEVGKHPSTVGYWVKKHGLRSQHAPQARRSRRGRARDASELVERGLSVRQIGEEIGLGFASVRHWLAKYGLRTDPLHYSRRDAEKPPSVPRECPRHGWTDYVPLRPARLLSLPEVRDGAGCRSAAADQGDPRRRSRRALPRLRLRHLHRRPPVPPPGSERQAVHGQPRRHDRIARFHAEEARKCVLLCANCHAEVEAGLVLLASPADNPG